MAPCSVVVGPEVLEHDAIRLVERCEPDAVNCFDLQAVEAVLGHGVVVAMMTFVSRRVGSVAYPFLIGRCRSAVVVQRVLHNPVRASEA